MNIKKDMAFVLGASIGLAWLFKKTVGINDRMRAGDIRNEEVQRDLDETRRLYVEAQRRSVESQRFAESAQRQLSENLRRMDEQNTGNGNYKFIDGIAGIDGVVRKGSGESELVTIPPCTLINIEIGPLEGVGEKDGFVLHANSGNVSVRTFDKVTGIGVKKWYGIKPTEFTSSVTFKLVGDKTRSVGVPVRFYYKI